MSLSAGEQPDLRLQCSVNIRAYLLLSERRFSSAHAGSLMAHRLRRAAEQIGWLAHEVQLLVGGRWWRWYTVWAGGAVWTVVSYRVDRAMFLLFGPAWALLRPLFLPLFLFFRLMGARGEIHYRASIGRGLRVLHPVLGVVVSARAVIGTNLTMVGGNCIGGR